ncbi:nuclear membrane fusion protein kar5 [Apiospora rasikravindrae]|uniref:Nuclear membrane fusion protein kar5 n=1 Tax=Apiospora rasikravindrae TaxID=990691 RepID=A0ABR1TG42_9PEZI
MANWFVVATLVMLFGIDQTYSFSWGSAARPRSHESHSRPAFDPNLSASEILQAGTRPRSTYEVALQELKQLESEPLCHQTAARLLVSNCQVLEGKDEATVLTDSGRRVRDFVDAYAASLAICDLERGRFTIPMACEPFQESTLTQLALQNTIKLHATSKQIDNCLSGLGASDSAWNTWISYRHKALRFCEAARADNEKTRSIQTFQRLTKIMSRMADDVDHRVDQRLSDLDMKFHAAGGKVESLSTQIEFLRSAVNNAEGLASGHLTTALMESANAIEGGTRSAENLQGVLEVLLQTILTTNAETAAAHEQSMDLVSRKTASEMDTVMSAMVAAMASASSLQDQIELSRLQSAKLEYRQMTMEEGMQRLADLTSDLSSKHDDHAHLLHQAKSMTTEILGTLQETAASAATVEEALSKKSAVASLWPYIWCPAASLVMGSNLLIGEAAGYVVSSVSMVPVDFGSLISFFSPWYFSSSLPTSNAEDEHQATPNATSA